MPHRATVIPLGLLLVVPSLLAATADQPAPVVNRDQVAPVSQEDRAFVEDLEHRSFDYFWEQADHGTGLVLDRARVEGGRAKGPSRDIASIAATGFGLTAICIGAEHGWVSKKDAADRVRATLQFFAEKADQEHGWFYHWMDVSTGERKWDSETSSVDTAFLLAGVLTAGAIFRRRSRDSQAGRRNLRPRGLPVDAEWRSVAALARLAQRKGIHQEQMGHLFASWACCMCWPSARPPIPFHRNPGMRGNAPSTNTETTNSLAAALCSRISIRRPGSISGTGATAASWISFRIR